MLSRDPQWMKVALERGETETETRAQGEAMGRGRQRLEGRCLSPATST